MMKSFLNSKYFLPSKFSVFNPIKFYMNLNISDVNYVIYFNVLLMQTNTPFSRLRLQVVVQSDSFDN